MQVTSSGQQPHRPGPLHQTNKTHKGGRHARKSSTTVEGKIKSLVKPISKVKRGVRLNQLHQNRKLKRERADEEKKRLGSETQPPLILGVLDPHLNSCESFLDGLRNFDDSSVLNTKIIDGRSVYVVSSRLRMRFKIVALNSANFDETLDIVKSLDLLLLLHRPEQLELDEDSEASRLLRAIHIHCLPSIIHILDGTSEINDPKPLLNAKRLLKSRITDDEKMHCIEKQQDYLQLFHILGHCKRNKSHFKEARPMITTDRVEIVGDSLTFLGFVREKLLSPNDLTHIVGYGDFQIKQIDILPDIVSLKPTSVEGSQVIQTLRPDPMKQETLEQENEVDPMEGEQTWPTAEELAAEVERRNTKRVVKKLPPGTSDYQGAWITEDSDDEQESSASSVEDGDGDTNMDDIVEEDEDVSGEDEDEDDEQQLKVSDSASIMDVDDYDTKNSNDKEFKILEKLREARLEEMFPDEIDTPSELPARVRFARFRGLKSFRTSPWDHQENLPPDYSRIFQFKNFQQTKRRVINEMPTEGANPGQYVRVHIANVGEDIARSIINKSVPPTLVGLLKYERKMTVMNILIKRLQDSNLSHPIRSKDELIFYVGFRKFKARPLFTNHSNSGKFKYERFLRDDIAMVATIYAPITFPPAPVLVFRANYKGDKELVASGSVLDSDPNRLIIKRIRLSGHPFKIHSKTAVIRFMFFNSEDVMYFKPVELSTKFSRRGHIMEPLGTHGHMKCTFDRKIKSDDCVFMNLYKRVFPRWTYSPLHEQ